ncbi:MAG: flagellar basal body-associated FliL family protein [Oceanospirillaceae bacterium]|nr:flagellar basal body-associated FliL family protein [Oceanospirillaceae bacterium]
MAEDSEAAAGGAKSRKWLIIGAVLAVLLLGGGGAAAFFLLGGEGEAVDEAVAPGKAEALYTKIRTLEGKPMFVVTLPSDDGRRHYMQAYVETLSRDPEVEQTLTLHMPLVVARLNALFGSQRFEVLRTIDGKRQLRQEATGLVQGIMQEKIGKPGVETLLFTNFVMQ